MICGQTAYLVIGPIAVTSASIPSLLAWPAFFALCLFLTLRNKLLGRLDFALLTILATLQIVALPHVLGASTQLNGYVLAMPFILFQCGYGLWRVVGKPPLHRWPWYRFGLLATSTILVVDIGIAFSLAPAPGQHWVIGGACFADALVILPAFLALVQYALLDCRSRLVFCSKSCREANRCLHPREGVRVIPTPILPQPTAASRLKFWKRGMLGLVCGGLVVFAYTALPFHANPDSDKAWSLPPATLDALRETAAAVSSAHKIPTPTISLADNKIPAMTRPPLRPGEASSITLGRPLDRPEFVSNPTLLKAVVAHETAHAIQNDKGKAFPVILIFLLYVVSIGALLVAMPTWQSIAVAATVVLIQTILLNVVPGIHWHLHRALQFVFIVALPTALLWMLLRRQRPSIQERHLPSARAAISASSFALVLFFGGGYVLGSMNAERELDADMVAACTVGPEHIVRALTLLSGEHLERRHPMVGALFDPFHPSAEVRLQQLSSVSDAQRDLRCMIPS